VLTEKGDSLPLDFARLLSRLESWLDRQEAETATQIHGALPMTDRRELNLMKRPKPPLPDPRLIQRIIRQRRLRARYFEGDLFADPAWDILLELTAARAEHRRVSVTSLCGAAAVPPTTALRWITMLAVRGLLQSSVDPNDKRRKFVTITDEVADAMARYFDELGKDAQRLI
jgi:DNA-binding MarR family transcriptional regulator